MKIAIYGKMCYGKTTVANILKYYNNNFKIYSFGQKVKDIATDLFQMQNKDRTLLTSIGTKMREIDPDIWAKYVMINCKDDEFVLIDDLRYQNEYEYLMKNGFKIIELTLPIEIQKQRIMELYPDNYMDHFNNMEHISEKGLKVKDSFKIDMNQDLDAVKDILYKYLNDNV